MKGLKKPKGKVTVVAHDPLAITQGELFSQMSDVESQMNDVLHTLRQLRAQAPTEVMQAYGGPDYPRHFSLGITQLETGMLWLGQVIEEPMA